MQPDRESRTTDHDAILMLWSQGKISARETCRRTGIRDSAQLLIEAGARGFEMPCPPEDEIERQAEMFARLLRDNAEP
ncbi:MAG: hypothetical protein OXE84_13315 [Rhodobacteraceae bacterium]|nr:hypothetical protein [Paracoccaceae bacterium]MCY4198050.1 hypothetical protein [Paracoccaceae bacterium]